MSAIGVFALVVAAACDSNSTPQPLFGPSGLSRNGTISGTVVRYGDQTPIAGVALLLAGVSATTDAQGRFTMTGVPDSGSGAITAQPAGYIFRASPFALSTLRSGVVLDLVQDAAPFSLPFYRALVRNGYESAQLQPTKPWTVAPSFYVKTTVEGSTDIVSDEIVDRLRTLFANSIPELTGGRLQLGAFESGTTPRGAEAGWVNITFYSQLDVFGRSTVGGNTGNMLLRYFLSSNATTNPNNCYSPEIYIADHEITHVMGYWHTPDVLVETFSGTGCPGSGRPAHTRYHAALMYSRPAGNTDPDVDPPTAIHGQAPAGFTGRPPEVSCRFLSGG